MLETLKKALKVKEIRKRLLYTFVMLIVVRLGCQIAIPFVNADMVAEVTSPFKEGGFSFLSAITGGSLENMSIFALNITPYITASIIMQLLTIAIPKLDELQKKNNVLLRKYNGDAKFARVHKRIREENLARKAANKQPIVSEYDASIMDVLKSIKSDIDQKVYDRNDILKKDAYFEQTVMTQIKLGIDRLGIASARDDRKFIQSRITKQYLDQYNQTYSVA